MHIRLPFRFVSVTCGLASATKCCLEEICDTGVGGPIGLPTFSNESCQIPLLNHFNDSRLSTSYQDRAGQTLQQVQQPPSVLQVAEHIFDGRLPRLMDRKLEFKKNQPNKQSSMEEMQLPHYLGELCIYPFGESFLLNCVMLVCGTKGVGKKRGSLKR